MLSFWILAYRQISSDSKKDNLLEIKTNEINNKIYVIQAQSNGKILINDK